MHQTRYSLIRVALLTVAISAMVGGCAAEQEPAPGPQAEPLNPQPLPPASPDHGRDKSSTTAGDDPGPTTPAGSSGTNGGTSGGGAPTGTSSSSSSGSVDAGGQ